MRVDYDAGAFPASIMRLHERVVLLAKSSNYNAHRHLTSYYQGKVVPVSMR